MNNKYISKIWYKRQYSKYYDPDEYFFDMIFSLDNYGTYSKLTSEFKDYSEKNTIFEHHYNSYKPFFLIYKLPMNTNKVEVKFRKNYCSHLIFYFTAYPDIDIQNYNKDGVQVLKDIKDTPEHISKFGDLAILHKKEDEVKE